MRYLFVLFFYGLCTCSLFALTPFSLESLKEVNVTLLDKQKLVSDPSLAMIKTEVENKLHTVGIKTSTKNFSNLLIKIQKYPIKETTLVHVTLSIVENVELKRASSINGIAISYTKDDLFETASLETDVKESVLFLMDEFLDQYKEENPLSKK